MPKTVSFNNYDEVFYIPNKDDINSIYLLNSNKKSLMVKNKNSYSLIKTRIIRVRNKSDLSSYKQLKFGRFIVLF